MFNSKVFIVYKYLAQNGYFVFVGLIFFQDLSDAKRSKPQKCKECGKILSSTSSYYVHLKKHSNNKPYHCTACDASFCRKPYLEVSNVHSFLNK